MNYETSMQVGVDGIEALGLLISIDIDLGCISEVPWYCSKILWLG